MNPPPPGSTRSSTHVTAAYDEKSHEHLQRFLCARRNNPPPSPQSKPQTPGGRGEHPTIPLVVYRRQNWKLLAAPALQPPAPGFILQCSLLPFVVISTRWSIVQSSNWRLEGIDDRGGRSSSRRASSETGKIEMDGWEKKGVHMQ